MEQNKHSFSSPHFLPQDLWTKPVFLCLMMLICRMGDDDDDDDDYDDDDGRDVTGS